MARKLLEMYEPQSSDLLSTFVNGLRENVQTLKAAFPVGYIYISAENVSPATFIGGQWKAIGSGRVLVTAGFTDWGFDGLTQTSYDAKTSRKTGGQSRHSHLNSMGFDGDKMYCATKDTSISGVTGNPIFNSHVTENGYGFNVQQSYAINNSFMRLAYTREQTNYPPFYTVYMWERTA